jgi:uncharacterized protein (TIGR02757 family)
MTEELKNKLIFLADKYENSSFITNDPCLFTHKYKNTTDAELSSFIAANLAFGQRKQIINHLNKIFMQIELKNKSPSQWILTEEYKNFFPDNNMSFYRMFTNHSMNLMFDTLKKILVENKSLGSACKKLYLNAQKENSPLHLSQLICSLFPEECNLLPHTKTSACKRMNLFLRWMVRDNSPVDLGLWKWFDKKKLLIPLDIHVLKESVNLGLINKTSNGKIPAATIKIAHQLTNKMSKIWPDDPVKADFALFGYGIDHKN